MSKYDIEFVKNDEVSTLKWKTLEKYPRDDIKDIEVQSKDGKLIIKVDTSASKKEDTAEWFNDKVNKLKNHIIHSRGGDNPPTSMYFAITGILQINSYEFEVTIGMNTSGSYNRWNICGWNILANSDQKKGWILKSRSIGTSTFHINPDGSYKFKISLHQ